MDTYRTFKRSAVNFEEFSKARKITVDRGLSLDQAIMRCRMFNGDRTPAQIAKGTKMEFVRE